jgi:hypothetical protein
VAAGAANAQTSWGGTFQHASYSAALQRVTVTARGGPAAGSAGRHRSSGP